MTRKKIARAGAIVALAFLTMNAGGCLWYALGKNAGRSQAQRDQLAEERRERERLAERVRELEGTEAPG